MEQAVEDYNYMWDFFEENLPGFNMLERRLEIDTNEVREEGLLYLMSHGESISIEDFLTFLSGHLFIFEHILHIGAVDTGFASLLLHPDHIQWLFDDVIFDLRWTTQVYGYLSLGREEEDQNHLFEPSRPTFQVIDSYTALIEIPSFLMFAKDEEELYELYRSFYEEATSLGIENLIFDVSQNGGGNDLHWQRHIVAPLTYETLRAEFYIFIRDSETIVNYIRFWTGFWSGNAMELHPIGDRHFDIAHPEDLEELGLYGVVWHEVAPDHDGTPAFEGNLFILIDRYVFSSSEAFASFAKETEFATLVGRPGGGSGIGMQPLVFSLPESGLLIRMDVEYGVNADGAASPEVGTLPHYDSGDLTPLDRALEIIEERRLAE